jgi:geranylgeranyl pyrophosphate synthase
MFIFSSLTSYSSDDGAGVIMFGCEEMEPTAAVVVTVVCSRLITDDVIDDSDGFVQMPTG